MYKRVKVIVKKSCLVGHANQKKNDLIFYRNWLKMIFYSVQFRP